MSPDPVTSTEVEDIYELSPLQQGMLFHTLFAPRAGLYFEQEVFRFSTPVNVAAFEAAWQKVIDRHQSLRTSVFWEDLEKPLQVVHRRAKLPLAYRDWRYLSPAQQSAHLEEFLRADRDRSFDLSRPPLMRLVLIQLGDSVYDLIWSFHHVLLDGWSGNIVLQEVSDLYRHECLGQEKYLPPARPYSDYIGWLQRQDMAQAEAYWRELLQAFASPTPLPVDHIPRGPDAVGMAFAEHEVVVPSAETAALKELARTRHLTVFTVIQGAWGLLLSRYCGLDDVVFGSVVSGRPTELEGVESIVGLFINTLPVRARIQAGVSVSAWLHDLQAQQLASRRFEYSPLVHVQRWSEVPRGVQLFDSLLIFENFPTGGSADSSDTDGNVRYIGRTNYALSMQVIPGPSLRLRLVYDSHLFERETIERFTTHFTTVLSRIVAMADAAITDVPMIGDTERAFVVEHLNETRAEFPVDTTLQALFEDQAEHAPEATAVVADGRQLTYRSLNQRANQLAHHLRRLGVGPETLVGVCLERTPRLLVALLGILKAGGAYVPLDAAYPPDRLAFVLDDAAAKIVVTEHRLSDRLPKDRARLVCLDTDGADLDAESIANPNSDVCGDNLAYVIYTSGSTGRPKGVMLTHRGLSNYLNWASSAYPVGEGNGSPLISPITFDLTITSMFLPLICGRAVHMLPQGPELSELADLLQRDGNLSCIKITPAHLKALHNVLPSGAVASCTRAFIVGGEALFYGDLADLRASAPTVRFINEYGPTEAVVGCCVYEVPVGSANTGAVPIGRPIANVELYILDRYMNPVAIGIPGELHIGGAGLARGYARRPDLTAEAFVPDPFSGKPGSRMYRTGDVVRYLPDGNIEYVGRLDNQVKVHGYRVELAEIETVLSAHPDVDSAVVQAVGNLVDTGHLVAYIVPRPQRSVSDDHLRSFLRKSLPEYMLPTHFVVLTELPMTANGKIDRNALESASAILARSRRQLIEPRTPLERILVRLYRELLNVERVGIHDDFFRDLDGHSLLATQLVSRIRVTLSVEVPLRDVFEAPAVADLARVMLADPATRERIETTARILESVLALSDAEVRDLLAQRRSAD